MNGSNKNYMTIRVILSILSLLVVIGWSVDKAIQHGSEGRWVDTGLFGAIGAIGILTVCVLGCFLLPERWSRAEAEGSTTEGNLRQMRGEDYVD